MTRHGYLLFVITLTFWALSQFAPACCDPSLLGRRAGYVFERVDVRANHVVETVEDVACRQLVGLRALRA